jgi:hypothetical protein
VKGGIRRSVHSPLTPGGENVDFDLKFFEIIQNGGDLADGATCNHFFKSFHIF